MTRLDGGLDIAGDGDGIDEGPEAHDGLDSGFDRLNEYMCEHEYGPWDYAEYSQDPEWAELHDAVYPDFHDGGDAGDDVYTQLEIIAEASEYEDLMAGVNDVFDPCTGLAGDYNCGACAAALEGRLTGTAPDAVAGAENIGTVEEMNAVTGLNQTGMTPDEIQSYALDMGPGFSAVVGYDRVGQEGHWFNVSVSESGRVYALDSQIGLAVPFDEYISDYAGDGVDFDLSK